MQHFCTGLNIFLCCKKKCPENDARYSGEKVYLSNRLNQLGIRFSNCQQLYLFPNVVLPMFYISDLSQTDSSCV